MTFIINKNTDAIRWSHYFLLAGNFIFKFVLTTFSINKNKTLFAVHIIALFSLNRKFYFQINKLLQSKLNHAFPFIWPHSGADLPDNVIFQFKRERSRGRGCRLLNFNSAKVRSSRRRLRPFRYEIASSFQPAAACVIHLYKCKGVPTLLTLLFLFLAVLLYTCVRLAFSLIVCVFLVWTDTRRSLWSLKQMMAISKGCRDNILVLNWK